LRLWLSLFVDAPEDMRLSPTAILPSLEFKVRQGDSLVQRIGNQAFPVAGHATVSKSIKDKVTKLKNLKTEYFYNKTAVDDWEIRQRELAVFEEILQAEIAEKQQAIFILKHQKRSETASLAGIEEAKPKQSSDLDKADIDLLESQIAELMEQKTDIRKEKPLIWNIEFAEIFVEKEGFDIIIGNPPYVQKEDIADPMNRIKDKKDYKGCLQEMVRLDFPEDFPAKKKIDAKSDLYTYFYIRALRLLNSRGIHTFICSNSWLDVGYGVWLQEFLLNRCPVELIIDNHAKRSFEAADVNTIISVIHAPRKKVDPRHPVKFVAFKKPFEEAVFTENLLAIEEADKVISNDIFRVYPITTKELLDSGTEYESEEKKKLGTGKYEGDKWGGKYLRAPDFFIDLIKTNKNIIKLSDVCQIDGYVHDNNTGGNFPKVHFIKSVKDTRVISLRKDNEGVIRYGVKKEGNSSIPAPLLMARTYGRDHLVLYNVDNVIGKEFYKIIPFNKAESETIAAFSNCTFFVLERELFGLTNLGGGGLKFSADDIGKIFIPRSLSIKNKKLLNSFFKREIKSIFEECGIDPESKIPIEEQEPKPLPDRAELDNIVFDALNLTKDERKEVYRAVCRLVWNRISKARSV